MNRTYQWQAWAQIAWQDAQLKDEAFARFTGIHEAVDALSQAITAVILPAWQYRDPIPQDIQRWSIRLGRARMRDPTVNLGDVIEGYELRRKFVLR